MEEKKKRFRPSLTAYRELESKLADQIDGTSRLVKDCDLWREKYRQLVKEHKKLQASIEAEAVRELKDKNTTLEQSNTLLSAETDTLRSKMSQLSELADKASKEVKRLNERSFWARVFNK